ncbi:hypothetical protein GGR52DRAFT_282970 [Hypoxylon sp. FL1284]|nr:hypothetical protein GGR52DRAFT_282970 [Hypoxylon sp. FL1284]
MSIMLFGSRTRGGPYETFHSANPKRRLASRRRSRQRSQCRREEEDDKTCSKCRRVQTVCTSSMHRRLGPFGHGRGSQERLASRQQHRQQYDTMDVEVSDYSTSGNEGVDGLLSPSPRRKTRPTNSRMVSGQSDSQSALAAASHRGVADLTPTSSGGCPSPPLSTPSRRSSLESETDVSEGSMDGFHHQSSAPPSQGEQDRLSNDLQHFSSMDPREVRMQKLWNLQRLLYQQLKRVRAIAEDDTLTRSGMQGHRRQLINAPYPIDGILSSTQTFIDIMDDFKLSWARDGDDEDDSSDDMSMVGSDREADDIWDLNEDIKRSPSPEEGRLSSLNAYDACPSDLMDTSMACMVVSCYARLMDIYDDLFKSLSNLLQFVLWRQSTLQSTVPRFQLGEFQLENCGSLQATIVVNILVHALRCIEKTMGISEDHSVARRGGLGEGQFGEEKMLDLITSLEANGSSDLKGRMGSLHGSIRMVNGLLDKIQSEQIEDQKDESIH